MGEDNYFFYGLVIGGVPGVVLHELARAAAYLAFRAQPRFAFTPWAKFGTVSAPGYYLGRVAFVAAGLAPPVLLAALLPLVRASAPVDRLIYIAAMWAFLVGMFGSAGDPVILRLRNAMSYGGEARFEDTGDGFDVFGPTGR